MISVQNRLPEPGKENRVSITPDNGSAVEGVLAYADDATQEGTFWNRKTAQLLQGDIRTYPVREGQSISAGDVVNVGGSPETVYRDVVPQDNVEKTVISSAVSATCIERLTDAHVLVYVTTSSYGYVSLIDGYTGEKILGGSEDNSNGISSASISKISDQSIIKLFIKSSTLYANTCTIIEETSISFGSQYTVASSVSNNAEVIALSDSLALSIYNSSGLKCKALPISGTTITTSGTVYSLSGNTGANYISSCKLPDDTNGNKRVCICFSDTGDSNKGKAVIATIDSSNMVTFGNTVTFESNEAVYETTCDLCIDCAILCYRTSEYHLKAAAISADGNLVSSLTVMDNEISGYIASSVVGNKIIVSGRSNVPEQVFTLVEFDGSDFMLNSTTELDMDMRYPSACTISENQVMYAYCDLNNSQYGTTTIFEVLGNQIAGSFIDNSQDAIALADGTGGQEIPVGFGGYCECPGVTEGQEITSDGVSAFSPLDGWLSITDARNAVLVTGEYAGTGQSSWSIDVGFKPSVLLIQEVGFYSSGGYNLSNYIAFIKGSPYGGAFNRTNTTLNVTFTNTGLSFNGHIFNQSGYTYYYAAWR